MDYSALIGAGSAALVLIIGKAIEFFVVRNKAKLESDKQKSDTSIPVNEQAVNILKDIVLSMRKDMESMIGNSHQQDKLLIDCHEEKLTLKTQAESCKGEREALLKRLAELEARVSEQEKKK